MLMFPCRDSVFIFVALNAHSVASTRNLSAFIIDVFVTALICCVQRCSGRSVFLIAMLLLMDACINAAPQRPVWWLHKGVHYPAQACSLSFGLQPQRWPVGSYGRSSWTTNLYIHQPYWLEPALDRWAHLTSSCCCELINTVTLLFRVERSFRLVRNLTQRTKWDSRASLAMIDMVWFESFY